MTLSDTPCKHEMNVLKSGNLISTSGKEEEGVEGDVTWKRNRVTSMKRRGEEAGWT